jgi:hypothetical protein
MFSTKPSKKLFKGCEEIPSFGSGLETSFVEMVTGLICLGDELKSAH